MRFYFVIQAPALTSQTEKYLDAETSDRARKLEIKEFSNANFVPFVCISKDQCSPDKITPGFNEEDKDGDQEESSTTESFLEIEEENSDDSEVTEKTTTLMEEYTPEVTSEETTTLKEEYSTAEITTATSLLSGLEEIQTTTETPDTSKYQDDGEEDEVETESPSLEMTTEFVEESQEQLESVKELGEELLPYEGVVYYPEENQVEQTTDAIFIPNGDKEFLEVLPTKEPGPDFKFNLSLETTTEVSDSNDYYQEYQEEETTVTPGLMENENKSKIIFPFVATSYTSSIPIATYGL